MEIKTNTFNRLNQSHSTVSTLHITIFASRPSSSLNYSIVYGRMPSLPLLTSSTPLFVPRVPSIRHCQKMISTGKNATIITIITCVEFICTTLIVQTTFNLINVRCTRLTPCFAITATTTTTIIIMITHGYLWLCREKFTDR